MNTKKLNDFLKKQPIVLVCAVLCMAAAGAIYFRRDALTEAQGQHDAKTTEWEHIRDNVKNSDHLSEQFDALTQVTQTIDSRLIHADQLAINLQYFYKLESETHAKLTDLRQTGIVSGKNAHQGAYVAIGYAISAQGVYPQILDFLSHVENSEHFPRMIGLTLNRHASGGAASESAPELSLILNLELLGTP